MRHALLIICSVLLSSFAFAHDGDPSHSHVGAGATAGQAGAAPFQPPAGAAPMGGASGGSSAGGQFNPYQLQQQQWQMQQQQLQQQQQAQPQVTPAPPSTPSNLVSEITTVTSSGDRNLYATLETSMGKIKIELLATLAPKTVRNFVELASGQKDFVDIKTGRSERRPFYDGMIFHKVVKGFAIQTGCPYGTGKGGPGFTIPDELSGSLSHDKAGVVSMANTGKDTNGSQFFITLGPQPQLDERYTIFGKVVDGMDVVRKISSVKVGPTDRPLKRIHLKRVVISE